MTRAPRSTLESMWARAATIAAGSLLASAVCQAQVVMCGSDDAPIERVYVDLSFLTPVPLDSNQLFGDFGDQNMVELIRDPDKARWYVDSWRENERPALRGLTLRVLGKPLRFRPSKLGWQFNVKGEPAPRIEPLGGRSRCTVSVPFAAVRVWRARVIAEPRDEATPVPIDCRACGSGSKTEFTTRWIPEGESVPMRADFGRECTVELTVTEHDLPRTFSMRALYRLLPNSCIGLYGIAGRLPHLPVGGISIQAVPPQ